MTTAVLSSPVKRTKRQIEAAEVVGIIRGRSDAFVQEQIAKRRGLSSAERETREIEARAAWAREAAESFSAAV